MSIPAFWASRVSWIRTGRARALICWSLPLLSGYSTTGTSVIVPSATVSSTCTGPQRVEGVSRVTVAERVVAVPEDDVRAEVLSDDVPALPVPGATAEDWPPA